YNQIWLLEKDQNKTTFTTKWGTFVYAKIPFGLTNVGASFQRAMDIVYGELINKVILIYLDDLTVFTKMTEENFDALEAV
ncbi:hypothetical protein KI387_029632, partial [Taxus chinensis]